ncbi:MAG: carboxypeptidase regulatory-like domain-containing protein [Syntrophothermus sp.]
MTFTEPVRTVISGSIITDGTNAPVKKAKVSFLPASPTAISYLLSTVTDTLGNFSAKVTPGSYYVLASAERFVPEYYDNAKNLETAKQVTVTANTTANITISLAPVLPPVYYTVKGNVKSDAGRALRAKIQVFRLNAIRYEKEFCNTVSASTDSLGNYSVRVLSNDTIAVYAVTENKDLMPQYYNKKKTLQEADKLVVTGNTENINFVLETKAPLNNGISGTVRDSAGTGVSSSIAAYRVSDSKYAKYGVLSDSLGRYTISNMGPGRYIIQVIPRPGFAPTYYRKDGQQAYERNQADTLTITETSVIKDINFRVKKIFRIKGTSSITGWIKDGQGAGLNGAITYIFNELGQLTAYGISDGKGQFMADGLISGSYSIKADLFEYKETGSEYVSIDAEGSSPVVSLTLVPGSTTAVHENISAVPEHFSLKQNYPNPFNPVTNISYSIAQKGNVTLKVYNIIGKEIATLVSEEKAAGNYTVRFNAAGIPSGIYFYTLSSGSYSETKKLILLK